MTFPKGLMALIPPYERPTDEKIEEIRPSTANVRILLEWLPATKKTGHVVSFYRGEIGWIWHPNGAWARKCSDGEWAYPCI